VTTSEFPSQQMNLIRGLSCFAIPFGVYLLTLAPTVYNLDSAELTTAAATLGLTRATGYPLYILVGHLWSLLPVGDMGFRMNLFSAFQGALAIALTDRILRKLDVSIWGSLGAVLMLGFSFYYWALSLIAEVYTLQVTLVAATLLTLLSWKTTPNPRILGLVAFTIGCSFSNHLSTVLLIPGYLWFLLSVGKRTIFTKANLVAAALGFLAGISFYLYLPLRYTMSPPFNYAGFYDGYGVFHPFDLASFKDFTWLVSGRGFLGFMFGSDLVGYKTEITHFLKLLWDAFLGVGIGPGIVGLVVLLRSKWRFGVMSLLMFLGHTIFYIGYRTIDKELMFLPCFLVWAIWVGAGFDWMLKALREMIGQSPPWLRRGSMAIARAVIVSMVVFMGLWNWQRVDQSQDNSTRELGEAILAQMEPDSILVGYWETAPVIEYFQLVEGRRQDVKVINRFLISDRDLRAFIQREVEHRKIYMDVLPLRLPETVKVEDGFPLYILSKEEYVEQD
jgi:hypothetical protein